MDKAILTFFMKQKLVYLFVLEHQVEAREVRARMELPMVRAVLETGVSRNSVMQVIERRLRETGRGSLLEQQLIKRERERLVTGTLFIKISLSSTLFEYSFWKK